MGCGTPPLEICQGFARERSSLEIIDFHLRGQFVPLQRHFVRAGFLIVAVGSSLNLHNNEFQYFRAAPPRTRFIRPRFINLHPNQSTLGWAAIRANFATAGFSITAVDSLLILDAN